MKKAIVLAIAIIALWPNMPLCDIIHVPGDYPTIQAGIDAAAEGDTVMVSVGTYEENLIINHAVSLIGEKRDSTVIDGSSMGDVIYVEANNVAFSGFSITNCGSGIEDAGIKIASSDSCRVELCKFYSNNIGLDLFGSDYNTISRCTFEWNTYGIRFGEDIENPMPDSNYCNIIENNVFNDNDPIAIWFDHTAGTHHHSCKITGNRIFENDLGLSMIMSKQNEVICNHFELNVGMAITHGICEGGGGNNTFHHNNFVINNGDTSQVRNYGMNTDTWYSIQDEEGNYWSDYAGPDNNGDGIGDIPMDVEGDNSQDMFPLMDPLEAGINGVIADDGWIPISDVVVTAIGTDICDTSEYHGGFTLEGLDAGNYDLLFSHPDYRDTILYGVGVTLGEFSYVDMTLIPLTGIGQSTEAKPIGFSLLDNYPNPFNARTVIRYELPYASDVQIEIYDLLGRKIETLLNDHQPAGRHLITWDAHEQPSGIYFYRITAGDFSDTRRMVVLK